MSDQGHRGQAPPTQAPDAYYERAASWALSEQEALRGAAGRARFIAGVAVVVAVLQALALILLIPLKTSTMVPILVDRQTGFVQVLRPDGRQTLQSNAALLQSLLVQYVVARESFNITDVAANYHKVALWSAGPAQKDYLALMPASNPQSPLRIYPRTALVETWVKSVSPLGPASALVRFETRRGDQDARGGPPQQWAAVISYRFSNDALSASDRWLNPLGFQVLTYHRDAEVLPPVADAAAPAPLASPSAAAAGPSTNAATPPGDAAPAGRRP
jgi:type IV secretion system protein VirB8